MRVFFEEGILTPQPVYVIATYNPDDSVNVMCATWAGRAGIREVTLSLARHQTTRNLQERGAFTLSFATVPSVTSVDYAGMISAKREPRKLEKCGFTAVRAKKVEAPVILELPVALECKVIQMVPENNRTRVVGRILGMSLDKQVLADGKLNLTAVEPLLFDEASLSYYSIGSRIAGAWKDGAKKMT